MAGLGGLVENGRLCFAFSVSSTSVSHAFVAAPPPVVVRLIPLLLPLYQPAAGPLLLPLLGVVNFLRPFSWRAVSCLYDAFIFRSKSTGPDLQLCLEMFVSLVAGTHGL